MYQKYYKNNIRIVKLPPVIGSSLHELTADPRELIKKKNFIR